MKARDRFGALLAMGLVFQVGLQVALNIAVVTDTVPNTGISLPFFSYGGTSLMILFMETGIRLVRITLFQGAGNTESNIGKNFYAQIC